MLLWCLGSTSLVVGILAKDLVVWFSASLWGERMTEEEGRRSKEKEREPTDEFPVGMRVLAVDDDPTCLKLLENLLLRCQYNGLFSYNLSVFSPFGFLYITVG